MPVTKVNLKSFLVTELLRDFMIEASIYWWQLQKWPYLQFWICSSFIYSAINISSCIELFNINENYQVLPCLHGLSCILWKVIWSWAWRFKDAMKWLFYGDVLLWLNNISFSLLPGGGGGGGGGEPWISFSPSSLNTFCLVLQSYRADDTSINI